MVVHASWEWMWTMTKTVTAFLHEDGYVTVLMPDERPIRHIALEAEAKNGLPGDLSWRYYIPESYAAKASNENAELRELIQKVWKWERNGCYECPLEKDCKVLCVYDGDCGMAVEIEKKLQELEIELEQ